MVPSTVSNSLIGNCSSPSIGTSSNSVSLSPLSNNSTSSSSNCPAFVDIMPLSVSRRTLSMSNICVQTLHEKGKTLTAMQQQLWERIQHIRQERETTKAKCSKESEDLKKLQENEVSIKSDKMQIASSEEKQKKEEGELLSQKLQHDSSLSNIVRSYANALFCDIEFRSLNEAHQKRQNTLKELVEAEMALKALATTHSKLSAEEVNNLNKQAVLNRIIQEYESFIKRSMVEEADVKNKIGETETEIDKLHDGILVLEQHSSSLPPLPPLPSEELSKSSRSSRKRSYSQLCSNSSSSSSSSDPLSNPVEKKQRKVLLSMLPSSSLDHPSIAPNTTTTSFFGTFEKNITVLSQSVFPQTSLHAFIPSRISTLVITIKELKEKVAQLAKERGMTESEIVNEKVYGWYPVQLAIVKLKCSIVRDFLREFRPLRHVTTREGNDLLQLAARYFPINLNARRQKEEADFSIVKEVVQLLIEPVGSEPGLNINGTGQGNTPLSIAREIRNVLFEGALLELGAVGSSSAGNT